MGIDLIGRIRPVKFKFDNRSIYVDKCAYNYGQKDGTLKGEKEHYGIVAQELKNILEELNLQFDALGYDVEKDAYRMSYEGLIAPIIKSIQQLISRVDMLEQRVDILEK
jgi:hypothetical protein